MNGKQRAWEVMRTIIVVPIAAVLLVGAVFAALDIDGKVETKAENAEMSMDPSGNEVTAKGQVTDRTPDGESRSSVEGSVSKDGASVKVEQQHTFNFPPEIADPLTEAKDSIFGAIGIDN